MMVCTPLRHTSLINLQFLEDRVGKMGYDDIMISLLRISTVGNHGLMIQEITTGCDPQL